MASRFWVGGTANWDASTTTNWAATSNGAGGQSVPGTADDVTFDGSSGGGTVTVTATQAVISITSGAHTGTLNTNGQTITTTGSFTISGTGTRTITLGASSINCASWQAGTTTNLTFNANTSTITTTGQFFNSGGLTYNNVVITGSGSDMSGSNTFANLTRTGAASKTAKMYVASGATQTITGTLTLTGNSLINRLLISSSSASGVAHFGTSATFNAAAVSISNCDFQDITAAGAASPFTGTSIGNALGNTNITATTSVTRYWVAFSGGNWDATTSWSSSSGGASGDSVPLCHDTVVIDANSITSASRTITANMPRFGAGIDFTGVLNTPALSITTIGTVFGALTWVSGMTITSTANTLNFNARSSVTFTTGGLTANIPIIITAFGGTITQSGHLTTGTSRTVTLTDGTLNLNNNNLTTGLFSSSGSTTRTLTMGSGTVELTGTGTVWSMATVTGLTLTANTSTIKITDISATARTFAGGGKTYNNLWSSAEDGTATLTITGSNTFLDFRDDGSAAHSILFTAGTTTTLKTFTVSGTPGALITIGSVTAASHTLASIEDAVISKDYLSISRSTATPASIWYAGVNSIDGGNNSGWTFTVPPVVASGFFSLF